MNPTAQGELFAPIIPESRLHPLFKRVSTETNYLPGRCAAEQVWRKVEFKEHNFIQEFQSDGFDQRTWELYLHAFFQSECFDYDDPLGRPDLLLRKNNWRIAVEAATTGPSDSSDDADLDPVSANDRLAIRYARVLLKKLSKHYWKLNHVKDAPFLIALAPFHDPSPFRDNDAALTNYLYGAKQRWHFSDEGKLIIETRAIESHKAGDIEKASGFFDLPDAKHVSGVLFSNTGTFQKFNRMGYQGGVRPDSLVMFVQGQCYNPDPNASTPLEFQHVVGEEGFAETWGQGLILHHNPNALDPIPKELLPGISHSFQVKDGFESYHRGIFPFRHRTGMLTREEFNKKEFVSGFFMLPPNVQDEINEFGEGA